MGVSLSWFHRACDLSGRVYMTGPESVDITQDDGGEGFRGMRQLPKREPKEGGSWEDDSFKKYLRLRKITSSSSPKDESKDTRRDAVEDDDSGLEDGLDSELEQDDESPPSDGIQETDTRSDRLALPGPVEHSPRIETAGDYILTELPTDMKGIISVMYLIEFIKKRVGTDGIQGQLHHYHSLGWISEDIMNRLLSYSKMIMGDLGYFECELDDDVPTTTTLHHSKVLEIIFMIKNGSDISRVREFESPKLLKLFDDFTGRGVW